MLLKTNSKTHTEDINILSQQNQDYYNSHDQQFVAHKHDSGQKSYNQSDQQFIARK